jgi:hypothetical protein
MRIFNKKNMSIFVWQNSNQTNIPFVEETGFLTVNMTIDDPLYEDQIQWRYFEENV